MTFNQELITKARKGEIAILNDGSIQRLQKVMMEVWPNLFSANTSGTYKYYFFGDDTAYNCGNQTDLPAHSVKNFFMTDIKDKPIFRKENEGLQPRTYRVTRQQMKEVWLLTNSTSLRNLVEKHFDCFDDVVDLSLEEVKWMADYFLGDEPQKLLKSIFPEYFYIPEGEPVLCKRYEADEWRIRISDGKGGAYDSGLLSGEVKYFKQIIPFTKNPPK